MPNAVIPQNRYKADLRDMRFLLFEQFHLGELLGQAPFEAWGASEVSMVLDEAYKFACEVLGPLNAVGDREGCRIEGGQVKAPTGFKSAWEKLYEAGWKSLVVSTDHGGQGAPEALYVLVEELLSGANTAFNMYSGLAYGAAEVIHAFGNEAQRRLYAMPIQNGRFGGTMCLTEPQAGSDVGAARTSAKKRADGRYDIRGTKIFISGGDQDMTENIVHLVLARAENAPPGTKGLSLFVVPKRRVGEDGESGDPNDVTVGSIEHKMGINGSSTCVLNFGENDACVGELLGPTENQGMPQMFKMMNGARISVGVQGVAVAAAAYQSALDYAKERKQGAHITQWKDPAAPRVPIIEHPDVRRMLLDMKARVEGIRALAVKLGRHEDAAKVLAGKDDNAARYHQGQVDLLVPLVKAYATDQAFQICEEAIQVFGGAGYTRDYPVEQYCRDAKIFSIYEGTNHIQAMDLVGRKMGQAGGANLQAFLGDVNAFIAQNDKDPVLGPLVKELSFAQEALAGTAMRLLGWFTSGRMPLVPLAANAVLEMMSEVAVGWLLLEGARVALDALPKLPAGPEGDADRAFYEGKKFSAIYFAKTVLPRVKLAAEVLGKEDASALDIPTAAFSTV